MHFGDGDTGYEASITAAERRTGVQRRGSSLEAILEMSRGSREGQRQKEDGVDSATPGDADSGIQVVKELRLDSDSRPSKAEA